MERRFLGRSGLEVSTLSFGVMTFGDGSGRFGAIGNTQNEDARRQIDMAIDAGVTLFDTADVYSRGQSEEILGQALGDRRHRVLIATKVFGRMGKGDMDWGLSRRHIVAACDHSLRRLKTDWIDLYQVHNVDTKVPMEEALRTLDDLVRAGKVRYVGCSNHFAWQLTKALGVSERLGLERYVSQQIQYSLLVRDAEIELLPAGVDQGVGALIWSPLAQGYLSGKFRGGAQQGARLVSWGQFSTFDTERGRKVVDILAEIAAAHVGASPSQVALNWLLARAGVTSVIVGARTEAQLKDNLAAATWRLSTDEIVRLDEASELPAGYPHSTHKVFHPERNPAFGSRSTAE
jgi:aryl-alcohol dehydrogenase-like predicted oxidoreductase